MIHEEDIKWKMVSHMALKNQYHGQYADVELGVTKETITKRTNGGYGIGKCKTFYFIDGDAREFLSAEDLVDAYNEKFKFSDENPNHEVTYVKVIKKKSQSNKQ